MRSFTSYILNDFLKNYYIYTYIFFISDKIIVHLCGLIYSMNLIQSLTSLVLSYMQFNSFGLEKTFLSGPFHVVVTVLSQTNQAVLTWQVNHSLGIISATWTCIKKCIFKAGHAIPFWFCVYSPSLVRMTDYSHPWLRLQLDLVNRIIKLTHTKKHLLLFNYGETVWLLWFPSIFNEKLIKHTEENTSSTHLFFKAFHFQMYQGKSCICVVMTTTWSCMNITWLLCSRFLIIRWIFWIML